MSEGLRFDGQVAFVTGGSAGMGRGYCKLLASRGAKVAVNGSKKNGKNAQVVEEIRAAGGEAIAVSGSVTDAAAIERMIGETVDAYGRLDILINNAGTSDLSLSVIGGPDERLYDQLEIHALAPMRTVAAAWKYLTASGSGRIVNISSSSTYGVAVDGIWDGAYGVAKSSVFTITRQMAGAGEPYGVKANTVVPWAYTPMVERNAGGSDFAKWMEEQTPIERVAAVVAYLVHRDCAVSGQAFTAAGGRVNRVFYGATRGYYNPNLTPEDVQANIDRVMGKPDADGYYPDIFDIPNVAAELAEHQAFFEGRR